MSIDPQWVIAGASSIAALGVIGVAIQCTLAVKQFNISTQQLGQSINSLKADHERSRREKAVELLGLWDAGLTEKGAIARKLAETFDSNQSRALFKQQSFEISSQHYELFIGALSVSSANKRVALKPEEKIISVSESESAEIRWAIVSYLNQLEFILTAVRHEVADKKMIYEQFEYLVAPTDGHYVLEDFREAAGGARTFPSIETFANELKEKHRTPNPGKDKIA